MQSRQQPRRLKAVHRRFVVQLRALIVKTGLVQIRRPSSMLMFLIAPSLFIMLLGGVVVAVKNGAGSGIVKLGLAKCSGFDVYGQLDKGSSCTSVAFAVNSPNGTTGRYAVLNNFKGMR